LKVPQAEHRKNMKAEGGGGANGTAAVGG
jgi:hypothetical protein